MTTFWILLLFLICVYKKYTQGCVVHYWVRSRHNSSADALRYCPKCNTEQECSNNEWYTVKGKGGVRHD